MLTSNREPRDSAGLKMPHAWLLALDTSGERAGVALWNGEDLHETQWPADRRQTTEVMPRVDALLNAAALDVHDLVGAAVAQGPGTFTGLRVGMSIAKGLALSLGVPIAGVSTLEATALPWLLGERSVMAVLPAGRGRMVWQRFARGGEQSGPVNGTPAELLHALRDRSVDAVIGELPASLRESLADAPVPVLGHPGLGSRVGAVALLGRQRIAEGASDDLATLEPIYVHGTSKVSRPVRDARP